MIRYKIEFYKGEKKVEILSGLVDNVGDVKIKYPDYDSFRLEWECVKEELLGNDSNYKSSTDQTGHR